MSAVFLSEPPQHPARRVALSAIPRPRLRRRGSDLGRWQRAAGGASLAATAAALFLAPAGAEAKLTVTTLNFPNARLTSEKKLLPQLSCDRRCSGTITVRRAGGGRQPTFARRKFTDRDMFPPYGVVPVRFSRAGLRAVARKPQKVVISVRGKDADGKSSARRRITVRKPLPVADPCKVVTQAEASFILGAPAAPGQPHRTPSVPADVRGCTFAVGGDPFAGLLGVVTTRGDAARRGFGDSFNAFDTEQEVPGPWRRGRTFANSNPVDTAAQFQALRGEDHLLINAGREALGRMVAVAKNAIARFPR